MSKTLNIIDGKGAAVGQFALDDKTLEFEKGTQAVHDTVIAYLAGERAGTASTKTRAEVRGGGRKPWRQKGTGRARCGSSRSPVWAGGGVTFGPKPRSFAKKINKRVRKLALKRAFSERVKEESVIVLDRLELPDHKTKSMKALLKAANVAGSALVVVKDYEENVMRAAGNMADVMLVKASSANVYSLLRFEKIVFTKEALEEFTQRLA